VLQRWPPLSHHTKIHLAEGDATQAPACSLDREALAKRLEEWSALRVRALINQRRDGRVVISTWRRSVGVREALTRLMHSERDCCAFLSFELADEGATITLRTTFPESIDPELWHSIG
jgi:hypothetical protein